MTISEIPLSADNQQFAITIAGTAYRMRLVWRESFWCLDLLNSDQTPIVLSLPLFTGADLLGQYAYLDLGFSLYIGADAAGHEPTKTDLGFHSHLYIVTE
ncbi:phage baseplate plug family protein [Citrobacter amalonaticus]